MVFYSCTHQWRTVFFDGVPDPETYTVFSADSTNLNGIVLKSNQPKNSIHKPFEEKKCNECHDKNSMGKLKMEMPNLCYKCHENVEQNYSNSHGPFSSGNCTQCHSAHKSKNEYLLIKQGNDLCLNCHENKFDYEENIHNVLSSEDCTQCHNPHGSNSKNLIKTNTCFNCHEDFRNEMNYIHGPVGAGNCNLCHDNHNSNKTKLLVKEGNDLCLNCHSRQDFQSTDNLDHKDSSKSCKDCHSSHASLNKYLLIKSLN